MLFVNTRPSLRALPLTNALQKVDIEVFKLPLLELTPVDISPIEQHYQQNLKQGEYAAIVCISPTAASLGLQCCQRYFGSNFRPNYPVIAVGDATARMFNAAGWQARRPNVDSDSLPQYKIGTNESMMQMPELTALTAGQKVLIWRGEGGRRLLVNHLKDKGITVEAIAWYKRQCPSDLSSNFARLHAKIQDYKDVVVLISSAQSFTHWQQLLQSHNEAVNQAQLPPLTLFDFRYLALGDRLAAILRDYSLQATINSAPTKTKVFRDDNILRWQQVENLAPETIKKAIANLS